MDNLNKLFKQQRLSRRAAGIDAPFVGHPTKRSTRGRLRHFEDVNRHLPQTIGYDNLLRRLFAPLLRRLFAPLLGS